MSKLNAIDDAARNGQSYWLESGAGERVVGYWTGESWALGGPGQNLPALEFEPVRYREAVSG